MRQANEAIGRVVPRRVRRETHPSDASGRPTAVTARARRELDQKVVLIDPFGMTGCDPAHALNWLGILDPDSPDVVPAPEASLTS